jgi:hypothetical protein
VKDSNSFLQEIKETAKHSAKIIEIISDEDDENNSKKVLSQKQSQYSVSQKNINSDNNKLLTNNEESEVIRSDRRAITKNISGKKVALDLASENTNSNQYKQSHNTCDITNDIRT